MREDYEDSGFNPFKIGIAGAIIVAAAIAVLLGFRSYSATKEGRAAAEQQIEQLKSQNEALQKQLDQLKEDSTASTEKLKKQFQQRESQLTGIVRQKDYEGRAADAHIAQVEKRKTELENAIAQAKKEIAAKTAALDARAADIKRAQDQLNKTQADLQKVRMEADRNAKDYSALKQKLDSIEEGDQAAADRMVQELADARRELKREQGERKKLEEQLESLKGESEPPPQ
jgi:chromosome segregation ATPase